MIRLATADELKNWNKLVAQNPDGGHLYQSYEWGDFKSQFGWQPLRVILEEKIAISILKKYLPFAGNIYYLPKGPGIFSAYQKDVSSLKLFKQFTAEIKNFILKRDKKALLVKIEPELLEGQLDLAKFGYQKAAWDLQFKATIIVDISPPEDQILSSFKQKTRYNLNLARRRGIQVKAVKLNQRSIDLMYNLMRSTQQRAGFFLRRKSYFASYWQALEKAKMGQLFLASYKRQVLAGIFVTIFNQKAYYKDGGSLTIYRNLMAPYLLQWEAIRWAKSHGATSYDLVAVPPISELDNPNHLLYGLYQFKRGFAREVVEFVGCWDLILSNQPLWRKIEKIYTKLYAKIFKNLFY